MTDSDDPLMSGPLAFILLLCIELLALLSTAFILIHVAFHWNLMFTKARHNHAILLLIVTSFAYIALDLPFTISSYRLGYDIVRGKLFCAWWYWLDYSLLAVSLFITATASVQRYILIFKAHLLRQSRARWLLHYIPLLLCLIYPPIIYLIAILFYPCSQLTIDDGPYCSSPCYTYNSILITLDWILHSALPLLTIVLAHLVLATWMLYSMRRLKQQQPIIWKRQKTLLLQLLAFGSLYVVGWAPATIVALLNIFFPDKIDDSVPIFTYLTFTGYFICPLQPLICLFVLTEPIRFIKDAMKGRLGLFRVTPVIVIGSAI